MYYYFINGGTLATSIAVRQNEKGVVKRVFQKTQFWGHFFLALA